MSRLTKAKKIKNYQGIMLRLIYKGKFFPQKFFSFKLFFHNFLNTVIFHDQSGHCIGEDDILTWLISLHFNLSVYSMLIVLKEFNHKKYCENCFFPFFSFSSWRILRLILANIIRIIYDLSLKKSCLDKSLKI